MTDANLSSICAELKKALDTLLAPSEIKVKCFIPPEARGHRIECRFLAEDVSEQPRCFYYRMSSVPFEQTSNLKALIEAKSRLIAHQTKQRFAEKRGEIHD